MRNSIALAMVAALALSACDMIGAGRPEKGEGNRSAEENSSGGNSSRSEEGGSDRSTSDEGNSSSEDRGGRDGGGSADEGGSDDGGGDSARSTSGGSRLERELQAAVRAQQSRLPMRDGPGTITAMEAEGNRLIVTMNVEQDFGESEWDQMAAALQRNICGDRASSQMIGRGAEVVYRITDGDGERQNMITNRCD
jgi:hypothetical protein